jgi:hypothetical protein
VAAVASQEAYVLLAASGVPGGRRPARTTSHLLKDIATPGVAECMLEATGFGVLERVTTIAGPPPPERPVIRNGRE